MQGESALPVAISAFHVMLRNLLVQYNWIDPPDNGGRQQMCSDISISAKRSRHSSRQP